MRFGDAAERLQVRDEERAVVALGEMGRGKLLLRAVQRIIGEEHDRLFIEVLGAEQKRVAEGLGVPVLVHLCAFLECDDAHKTGRLPSA